MGLPRSARRAVPVVVGVPCVVVVTVSGELTPAALLAVTGAGGVVAAVALAARSGATAPPVGRAGRPWLLWIALVLAWEVTVLALPGVPSLSDLLDPVLAQPLVRAAATAGWLAAGGWLLARPSGRDRP
ncbi:hypothetical protein [Geodermatophilus sp. CPCC 205761]|uniref:hypothetical protein n=1 Tax=Geodermatophilus sp. CPCC 205761 TaxID=2936597 RepID=UPI003EEA6190